MKVVGKTPWPLSNRVMFSTRFIELDVDGGHMCLFSADGNGRYVEECMTAKEKKDLVVAHVFVSGWWVKPIRDAEGNVTASEMLYMN